MKKSVKVVLLCMVASLFLVCGCSDSKNYGLDAVEDFHIQLSATSYDFLSDINLDLDKSDITVDSSAVDFGTVGSYDVKITYKSQTITKKCYVYGTPEISGTPAAISYADAVAGRLTAGLTAKDSFDGALEITVVSGIAADNNGKIAYGEHEVEYAATDRAGNVATVKKNVTVKDDDRPTFDDVKLDIADGNFSLVLGEISADTVIIDGEVAGSSAYSAKNGVMIVFDSYLATLEYEVAHKIEIIDKAAGWSEFSLTVEDKKALNYSAPMGKGFTYPAGTTVLPVVEIHNPLQNHTVTYKLTSDSDGSDVALRDGTTVDNAEVGSYTYEITVARKGAKIYNETFFINILSRSEYDSKIFLADSDQFMDNLYADKTLASPSQWNYKTSEFSGSYTDSKGVTKNAALFDKVITDMNYQRDIYIVEDSIVRMLNAGYKSMTIELCMVGITGSKPMQIQVMGNRDGKNTDCWINFNNNEWKSITFDMTKMYDKHKEGISGILSGFRFINLNDNGNAPFKVYISSITADYLYKGVAAYAGEYQSDDGQITLTANGEATITGKNEGEYNFKITDENVIILEDANGVIEGIVDNRMLLLDGSFYVSADIERNLLAGTHDLPATGTAFAAKGYDVKYYLVDDSEKEITSLSQTLEAGKNIVFRVKVFDDTTLLGTLDRTYHVLDEDGYYSQNLATEANLDKFKPLGINNSVSAVTHTDKKNVTKTGLCFVNTYTDGSNNYVFTIDKDFIQGAIKAGFTSIRLEYVIMEENKEFRLGEWTGEGWDYTKPVGYASTFNWKNDNVWESMNDERKNINRSLTELGENSTLLLHLNSAGTFYIADMYLVKPETPEPPVVVDFEKDLSAESSDYLSLWHYDSRNAVSYHTYTDKNNVSKSGIHFHNACYQNTDESRKFTFGAAVIAKAKEQGYTKIEYDMCLPVIGTEALGACGLYFCASDVWHNDNLWEHKTVTLTDDAELYITFTGENSYIANLRFTK